MRLGNRTMGLVVVLLTLGVVGVLLLISGGRMFSPGPLKAQGRGQVTLGGVTDHASLGGNCAACHAAPWSGETMADHCLDCHSDIRRQLDRRQPLHGKLSEGKQCRACHTEHKGAHGVLTNLTHFDHNWSAFPLTGKHRGVNCQDCHTNNVHKGTPQTCASCHPEPAVHQGKFGTDCAQCHTTSAWRDVALTQSQFNHGRTAFPLTGKHRGVDCRSCHVKNVFKGTPQTCAACHPEPAMHKGKFGTACAQCHSTTRWEGATFQHKFPLTHGRRKAIACATCHTTPQDYKSHTCYGCHEHQPQKIANRHVRQGLVNFQNCVQCHPTGREGEGRKGKRGGREVGLLEGVGCPQLSGCPAGGSWTNIVIGG